MDNYFLDNPDLQFIFKTADLSTVVGMIENDFADRDRYAYAPESVADALDSYRRVLEIAGDVAARIIAPLGERIDNEHNLVRSGRVVYSDAVAESVQALRQAELMGCTISRKYGGLNLPNIIFIMLVEMVSQADAGIQNIFGLQGVSAIIEGFADEELKQKYLPLFAEGKATGAMALTEDEAGSDLQNVKLKAEQDADGTWRLNGVKRFITNGGAEVLLVLARSEAGTTDGLGLSLFLCEGGDTVTVRRLEDKLGIHGSPTCELGFDNTPAYLIGERQRGLVTYVLTLLNGARLATAAQAIGIAQAAFDEARAYARVRKQYGRRIEVLPPVAEMLTTMKISIEGARALNYETALIADLSVGIARKMEQGGLEPVEKKKFRKDAKKYERLSNLLTSLTKYYGSEMSNRVTHDAMQVLGGSGYMRDYPVEKYYRDARITNIYEGTSQMQVVSAFRGILSGTLEKYFEELSAQEYPRRQGALARRLLQARKLLSQAVEHLNTDRNVQIMDLAARTVVDMGTDILIGYLFLKQSLHAPRKLTIASLFIKTMLPVLQMRLRRVKAEDSSCLKQFAVIVDQA